MRFKRYLQEAEVRYGMGPTDFMKAGDDSWIYIQGTGLLWVNGKKHKLMLNNKPIKPKYTTYEPAVQWVNGKTDFLSHHSLVMLWKGDMSDINEQNYVRGRVSANRKIIAIMDYGMIRGMQEKKFDYLVEHALTLIYKHMI